MMMNDAPHLVYFADPMCSWCWGFSPVIEEIEATFGDDLPIRLIAGGLRPGTGEPMNEAQKAEIRHHWEHVNEASGQPFDYRFFERDGFVYDTEPACRAVVVLRRQGMAAALAGLRRIHMAFYAENRDVTREDVLTALAAELGHPSETFSEAFNSEPVKEETQQDFALTQSTGVGGFPTLIAGSGRDNQYALVTQGFQKADQILPALERWLASQ